MYDLANVCNLVIGVILIHSLRSIRRFYAEHGEDQMDFAAMIRHASCFVLYLAATLIYMSAYTMSVFVPTEEFNRMFQWSTIVFFTSSFGSNLLLAYIFYDVFRDQKQVHQIDEMQRAL